MVTKNWGETTKALKETLGLQIPPLGIAFSNTCPDNIPHHTGTVPNPSADGRTGRVTAGCVFWVQGVDRAFTTVPEDHFNCSVGSVTHGLKTLEEVMGQEDVVRLVESGWVTADEAGHLPVVQGRFQYITYAPLAESTVDPDVILLRLNPFQSMTIHDAFDETVFVGKPQCHIIPLSKEHHKIAISTGCMLSRVRTGMSPHEMTCTLPAKEIDHIIKKLKSRRKANSAVTTYANRDAQRFSPGSVEE